MTKCTSHRPKPAWICNVVRGGAGLPQATPAHCKSADASLRKAATPIPIVSSQAFEATHLQLTLPPIATLANGSRTLSP